MSMEDGPVVVTPTGPILPVNPGVAVTNLCPNPSFETDLAGWNDAGIPSSQVGNGVVSGSFAMRETCDAGHLAFLISTDIPVTEGLDYTFSGTSTINQGNPGQRYSYVRVQWWDDNPDPIGAWEDSGPFTGRAYLTTVAPPLAVTARVWLRSWSVAFFLDDTCDFDAVMFTEGTTLYDYFDGDFADDDYFTYAWDGTPHASTSTRTPL